MIEVALSSAIGWSIYPSNGLSNGDIVNLTIIYDPMIISQYNFRILSGTIPIRVSGLTEVTAIDVFEGLDIHITGVSPLLTVRLENNSDHEFVSQIGFRLETSAGSLVGAMRTFAIGDEFRILFSIPRGLSERLGYVPLATSLIYVIPPSHPKHITSLSQIDDLTFDYTLQAATEHIHHFLQESGRRLFSANTPLSNTAYSVLIGDQSYFFRHDEPVLVRAYLKSIPDASAASGTRSYLRNSSLSVVFRVEASGGRTCRWGVLHQSEGDVLYISIVVPYIVAEANGNISIDRERIFIHRDLVARNLEALHEMFNPEALRMRSPFGAGMGIEIREFP